MVLIEVKYRCIEIDKLNPSVAEDLSKMKQIENIQTKHQLLLKKHR